MITITFSCGHQRQTDGSEEELKCQCGESTIARIDAPMPTFTGHVTGPHAIYKDLEAKALNFGGKSNG